MGGKLAASVTNDLGIAYANLYQNLRSFLRRRVSDATIADDLVQDIFVKALVTDVSGRSIANVTAWLYTAARTTLIDYYRAQGDMRTNHTDIDELHEMDLNQLITKEDDIAIHAKLAECLRPFIDQLAPKYRDALIASDLDGTSLKHIADNEGVSLSAIKSRVSRGRIMLKEKLLACCHVEHQDGLVSDYYRHPKPACAKPCT
ncbi:sigma-70 family RNA polymerase sigma factor [Undibacterium cyanobacteriorum]|uniref:Sigma-70 family RNA polymerase sigma factor n=1 Tax=Undibacterium cyanobacteriorum TaxID=3073561 RepID=A0ABY9RK10_9BURK|nr:sigma-70 family RNA polymerase sigma factor [Undibacterium sp. 20NA77.5]WMW81163.1 sigma-70 family RNA polymerase sigma factor [Undibacterium sp. 20NA77.5]